MPSSRSPWCARLNPSVEDSIGAMKAFSFSLRRTAKYASAAAIASPAATSRMISTLPPPTSPSRP